MTNAAGVMVAAYSYDAYGNTTLREGSTDTKNPYTYNGEYDDSATSNQYLRARYYDMSIGGFLTEDSY